jgi:hypothetical protein
MGKKSRETNKPINFTLSATKRRLTATKLQALSHSELIISRIPTVPDWLSNKNFNEQTELIKFKKAHSTVTVPNNKYITTELK